MRVLVTGGAGFIGSNVVDKLIREGCKVFCLDDFSNADFKNLVDKDCEIICGDVRNEDVFKKFPRLDAIIHEAAVTDTTINDDKKMMSVNFEGFRNVLKYCFKKRISLVYASSAGVYGDGPFPMRESQSLKPLNTYAYSKFMCDKIASTLFKKKDAPLIVGLRYFNVYGPAESHKGKSASMIYQLYLQMREGKSPRLFKFGEQKRDFVYIKDVASITIKALSLKKSTIINVGTGRACSFNSIVKIINKVLKKKLTPYYFDNPYSKVYQDYTQADISLLKRTMKIRQFYFLEEGIEDYIKNYLEKSRGKN